MKGLRKLVVYVSTTKEARVDLDAMSSERTNIEDLALETSTKAPERNTDALRAAEKRVKLGKNGMTQMNIVIRNTAEFRREIAALAKRTTTANSWEDVIRADPLVKTLERSLKSAETRLLRLDDLEERLRRTHEAIAFQHYVMTSRGFRRLLLYFAGIVKAPIC